jgi:hypothetical protein
MTSNNEEIVLDPSSGISIEEQNEILTQINGIAEKNRRYLSQKEPGTGKKLVINAKKSGAFFPLAVNIAAVIVLCAGAFILIQCNSMRNAQIRTGGAVDLELAGTRQEIPAELELAMIELERFTTEQERIDAIDAMISGGLITVSDLIQENQFDQAALEVEELRQFLNNNFLASSHAFQSRKVFYNQLFNFADTLIEDARRQFDLILLAARQEDTINDLQIAIESLGVQRDTLIQTVETRDDTIAFLRDEERNLSHTIAERNSEIMTLAGERSTLTQNLAARDSTITSLETQRNTLNQTLAARDSAITSLRDENAELQQTLAALRQIMGL